MVRVYFSSVEDMNEFIIEIEKYKLYNYVPEEIHMQYLNAS